MLCMEQEELEKRLKIEPCADEVELDFILDIKKYDHLSKELKKDLIKLINESEGEDYECTAN